MVFFTKAELSEGSNLFTSSKVGMESLKKYATLTESMQSPNNFDYFISHSFIDKHYIETLYNHLKSKGYSVYVDWLVDTHLNRNQVTPQTAELLRKRMDGATELIFATSQSSSDSKWMPWELGYFHGNKGETKIKILPIVASSYDGFSGVEFLGLYDLVGKEHFPGKRLY